MATKANLVVDQGTTFSTVLTLTDNNGDLINLNGYSANSLMKKWYTSTSSTQFTTSINTTSSEITLSLTANQTNSLTAGRYVYDVELKDSANNISRIVEGIVTVTPSVTKD